MQTFGIVSLCASSSAVIARPPAPFSAMRSPASTHTVRSAAMKSRSASSCLDRFSCAVLPKSAARAITIGTATSTQDTV